MEGLGADSVEKRVPVSDINTAVVDSLKVLDLKWPIREEKRTFGGASTPTFGCPFMSPWLLDHPLL